MLRKTKTLSRAMKRTTGKEKKHRFLDFNLASRKQLETHLFLINIDGATGKIKFCFVDIVSNCNKAIEKKNNKSV